MSEERQADEAAGARAKLLRRNPLLNAVLWGAVVIASLMVVYVGKNFFIPIVVALIAVYLIHAVSRAIRALHIRDHHLPGPVCIVLAFVLIFSLGYLLFSIVADNAMSIANEAPKYQALLLELQRDVFQRFGVEEPDALQQFFRDIDLRAVFTTVAGGLASLLGNVTLVFLYSIFLLLEIRFIPAKLDALFPNQTRRRVVDELIQRIDRDIQRYLGVKTLVSFVTALLSYTIMRVMGLDFAEFWGLLIFVFNFIPTIGSILATILPSILAVVQFQSWPEVLIIIIGITAIQQLMGSIIEPNIMGETLNLSPLVVVLSLIMWGSLWGIVGMFLCVPITVILVIILSNFETTRWVAVLLSKTGSVVHKPSAEEVVKREVGESPE